MKKIKVTYLVALALILFVLLMIVTFRDLGITSLKESSTETFETLHKVNSNKGAKETYDGVVIEE